MSEKLLCKSCKDPSFDLDKEGLCKNCAVLTLSVEAVRDFQVCELYYRYRYEEELPVPIYSRELMADKFENTLKKVAAFFFYKKQSDTIPSYNAILNRWEKLWFPKQMTAYDLAVEQHEVSHGNVASYSNIAAAALERFHDEFAEDSGDPILIDESFTVPLKPQLRLQGSLDLVLRSGDEYKVIKWISGQHKRSGVDSLMLDMAAMRLAFEYRNETPKKVKYLCYDLASPRSSYMNVESPTRADINALLYWAHEVQENEFFVPRRGFTAYCKGCPFDKPCAEFDEWPEIVKK